MSIGMNLNGITNYSGEYPFLDRMKSSGQWYIAGAPYGFTPAPDNLFDANGWPLGQPAGTSYSINIPLEPITASTNHRWVLTYTGTADFSTNSTAQIVSNEPGKLVFDATAAYVDSLLLADRK